MYTNQINELINRQLEIQNQIQKLSNEASELSIQIQTLNNFVVKSTSEIKSDIKKQLENKGYAIQTKKRFGSEVMIISRHDKSFTVLLKQSRYHDQSNYQSWFTLNPQVENFVDVFIFSYLDNQGFSNCIIINNKTMIDILNAKTKLEDGRSHIHFYFKDTSQIIETTSRIDLSSFKNNYSLFD